MKKHYTPTHSFDHLGNSCETEVSSVVLLRIAIAAARHAFENF